MPAEEDLSKLPVSELRKRIFWCGASVPSGHLEKSDLVAVLSKALAEKAEQDRQRAQKAEQEKAKQQKAQAGVPRPDARPLNYDQKLDKEKQEVVDLHVLPEEELKKRIEAAGGTVPEEGASRFYLIALLKNKEREAALLAEQAAAEAEEAQPPPPPPPPPGPAPAAAPAEARAAAGEAASSPAPASGAGSEVPFDDRDPGELSAGELRRRLRAYGAYGEEKLKGLAEKHEFVTALREAIAEKGPPPQPRPSPAAAAPAASAPAPKRAAQPRPVELSDLDTAAQMRELQEHLDAQEMQAAAQAGEAAAEAAASPADASVEVLDDAAEGPKAKVARRSRPAAPSSTKPAPATLRAGAPSAGLRSARVRPVAGKRKRMEGEVVVSDGEDDVCAVAAPSIDLDEDDDMVVASTPSAASGAKASGSAAPATAAAEAAPAAAPSAAAPVAAATPAASSGAATAADAGQPSAGCEAPATNSEGYVFL